jgi:ubiquitin C-terminal hydrolase
LTAQNADLTFAERIELQRKQMLKMEQQSQLSEGIVGLQNLSYYCYMNSCL